MTSKKRLETQRRYREKNREAIRAKGREYSKRVSGTPKYRERKRKWMEVNKYHLKKYDLSFVEWGTVHAAQGWMCAICKTPKPGTKLGWSTDHCHKTEKVRGILCQRCNLTLGKVKDDPSLLRAMADYIERHQ